MRAALAAHVRAFMLVSQSRLFTPACLALTCHQPPLTASCDAPWCGQVAIEIDAASQRFFPSPALDADTFSALLDEALTSLNISRAVVAGHSLGSAYVNYAVSRDARRAPSERKVSGVVLIDPISCNLHHAKTTREFVYTPIESAKDSFEDFLFKKELWTSNVIARQLCWHEGATWLDDCVPHVPTLCAVGTADSIVASASVRQVFGSWQARLRGVRVLSLPGCGHGEWLFNEHAAEELVAATRALRQEAATIGAAASAAQQAQAQAQTAAQQAHFAAQQAQTHAHQAAQQAQTAASEALAFAASAASEAEAALSHAGEYAGGAQELTTRVVRAFEEADIGGEELRSFLNVGAVQQAIERQVASGVRRDKAIQEEVQSAISHARVRLELAVASYGAETTEARSRPSVWPEYIASAFSSAFQERFEERDSDSVMDSVMSHGGLSRGRDGKRTKDGRRADGSGGTGAASSS